MVTKKREIGLLFARFYGIMQRNDTKKGLENMMSKVMDMTRGKPWRLMLTFAFPVILTNFGQQLYQIADAAIVGRGVGVDALAAVGCTDWTIWMVLWSVTTMTAGFATLVARFFGSRDYTKMNRAIMTSAVLTALIAGVLSIIGVAFARPLLLLMDTPPEILHDATVYLCTMLAGTVIVAAYNLAASILRALGDSKTPLWAMIVAAVLNIALDLLLVMVFHLGVFGAAFASVFSQLISFLFCLWKIKRIEIVRFDKESLRWDGRLAWETLAIGLPLAIQYVIINFGGMILQATVNGLGSGFVAGYTASKKLYGLLECTGVSLGAAFTTYTAQNYGARHYRRIRHGVNVGMLLSIGAAGAFMIVLLPLLPKLPLLFIDAAEVEAVEVGIHFLLRMILAMPILYLVYVHRSALQAIGVASWSLISGIFETVVRVSVATVGFSLWGEHVLYYSEPLSWLAAWLFVLVPYYFYQHTRVPKQAVCEVSQNETADTANT